jgi:hypothetical protein
VIYTKYGALFLCDYFTYKWNDLKCRSFVGMITLIAFFKDEEA